MHALVSWWTRRRRLTKAGIIVAAVVILIAAASSASSPSAGTAGANTASGQNVAAATATPAVATSAAVHAVATHTAAATSAPTEKPTPAATPGKTWTFSGSANKKTKPFTVQGTLRITYSVRSEFNYVVDLNGTDGTPVASVANLIGSGKVTTWVYGASGDVYLDVLAGGPWSITVTETEPSVAKVPAKFSGSTDVNTVPVNFAGGETVQWTHRGDGNFIVDLVDPSDGSTVDNLVNTIGKGADSTQVYDSGPLALDVTANGAWTLSIAAP